ncbi:MAG: PAS domain-containing protein [Rhodospirillaceae bacterium]|nr:PAS domain-containing protein [Rhodospirillaceae bacterium]MBT4042554.1 PAS domain-containing protein [Rhodospirillaceae bacterium]MBT5083675.1 PAS domain-containing protein [Rhodospirillaceae bacterium]MBT5522551.1 PAS domain-containing protein [Rhodospirillaceae bacterium]MBT5878595.1 PAS domain-containing protein [Rhodospirillaceae bacterium]
MLKNNRSNRRNMADQYENDRRNNGLRGEADKITVLAAEFENPVNEHLYRRSEANTQRRLVLTVCVLTLFLATAFSLVTGLQDAAPSLFFNIYRGAQLGLAVVLFILALRKADYRKLDYVLLAFTGMIVFQTILLQEIADPEKLGLLGRNLTVITIGHILLPTRYIYSCVLMVLMAGISLFQIALFHQFAFDEKLSLCALILALTAVGIAARWQREVTSRRRYRAARERDNLVSALRDSESRMRLISDNIPAFISYVDNQQILRFANQTGIEWYQVKQEDVLGFHLKKLLGANYDGARPYIDLALRGEAVRFERVLTYPDGKVRTIDVHHLPHRDESGEVVGYFNQAFDLTEVKQSELELRQARQASDAANRSKSEFLANMSHELRTPLNAVIGFSDAMRSGLTGELTANQMDYLKDISTAGGHLLSLINDILDLAKIEAGKLQISREDIDVDYLIADSLPFVREQSDNRNIKLLHDNQDHNRPALYADPRLVRQMLVNLLSNAVKFSPEGGVITIAATETETGELVITVNDKGIGMTPDEISKAMKPFEQTESGVNAGGTGLGLPLVDRMMALHEGSLELESITGQGTTASLRFPSSRCEADKILQQLPGAISA